MYTPSTRYRPTMAGVVIATVALAAMGCGAGEDPPAGGVTDPEGSPPVQTRPRGLSHGEMVTVLRAGHDARMRRGTIAIARARDGHVRDFARRLLDAQGHLADVVDAQLARIGVTMVETAATRALIHEENERIMAVELAPGATFDLEFLDTELDSMIRFLEIVDASEACRVTDGSVGVAIGEEDSGTGPVVDRGGGLFGGCTTSADPSQLGQLLNEELEPVPDPDGAMGVDSDVRALLSLVRSTLVAYISEAQYLKTSLEEHPAQP